MSIMTIVSMSGATTEVILGGDPLVTNAQFAKIHDILDGLTPNRGDWARLTWETPNPWGHPYDIPNTNHLRNFGRSVHADVTFGRIAGLKGTGIWKRTPTAPPAAFLMLEHQPVHGTTFTRVTPRGALVLSALLVFGSIGLFGAMMKLKEGTSKEGQRV